MKPKLQVSLGAELVPNYVEAVNAFGGEAYGGFLPEPDPAHFDGLVLSGGGDVDPARYGAANTACFFVDPARDQAELRLIRAYYEAGKPILGICRGHQLLNVAFGGSLIQDLPTAKDHTPTPQGDAAHQTQALPDSFLARLYGEVFPVNSAHHQGIHRLAPALEAVQWSSDGVVEAYRHRDAPIYSVQWHPERMCLSRHRPDTVDGAALFRWFIGLL